MNKVIIKRNSGQLTKELFNFGCQALDWFQSDLLSEKYGKDWCSCHYGYQGKHAITKLNKSGTITITVHD
jgi:hypothetical protein